MPLYSTAKGSKNQEVADSSKTKHDDKYFLVAPTITNFADTSTYKSIVNLVLNNAFYSFFCMFVSTCLCI